MKYDFTFFASSKAYGDVNVAYVINGVTTILNTSLNINGTQTIYGVTPDNYGNVTISVAPGTPTSQFGLIGALIIKGYTPSASAVKPTLPASGLQSQPVTQIIASSVQTEKSLNTEVALAAFPNPFHDHFNLNVSSQNNSKVQVMMYDVTGKPVYNNTFNMNKGMNSLKITANGNLTAGVYTVVVINTDTKTIKTIKVLKQ